MMSTPQVVVPFGLWSWFVTACFGSYQRYGGSNCLHHQSSRIMFDNENNYAVLAKAGYEARKQRVLSRIGHS